MRRQRLSLNMDFHYLIRLIHRPLRRSITNSMVNRLPEVEVEDDPLELHTWSSVYGVSGSDGHGLLRHRTLCQSHQVDVRFTPYVRTTNSFPRNIRKPPPHAKSAFDWDHGYPTSRGSSRKTHQLAGQSISEWTNNSLEQVLGLWVDFVISVKVMI